MNESVSFSDIVPLGDNNPVEGIGSDADLDDLDASIEDNLDDLLKKDDLLDELDDEDLLDDEYLEDDYWDDDEEDYEEYGDDDDY